MRVEWKDGNDGSKYHGRNDNSDLASVDSDEERYGNSRFLLKQHLQGQKSH